jgi:hypothetical protein
MWDHTWRASTRLRFSKNAFAATLLAIAASSSAAYATDPYGAPPSPLTTPSYATDPVTDYFLHWFDRKNEAQATQPHWMTPLATVTPRLEEEFRYDQFFQNAQNGAAIANFDGGKGLELIPTTTNEILLNLPAYQERTVVKPKQGTLDWGFLTIKQRFISAPEDKGNYIVTGFLGFTAPTGAPAFTNSAYIVTPTLAGGWGYGDFDVQGTVGVNFPLENEHVIGKSIVTNVAFQYHLFQYFWPEFEFNDTQWTDGTQRGGLNQLFVTPGVILGRFNLGAPGVNFNIGLGYQVAINPSPPLTAPVLTPMFNHAVVLTSRLTF